MTAVQHTLDVLELRLDQIEPNPDNIRRDLGDLQDLAANIELLGILEPLIVYFDPDRGVYVLIAGHRRFGAADLAGLATVPVVVKDRPDDVTLAEMMLAENTHREGLDPIDEALALERIRQSGKYRRVDQIAKRVNRSKDWVERRRLLLQLPEDLWPAVTDREVSLDEAETVARLKVNDAEKRRLFQQPDQIDRAVEDDRFARARKEAERDYGELLPPSELTRIRASHPWGIARLGSDHGQLNQPIAMHRGACDGHIAVMAFDGVTPQAFCTRPLDHLGEGIVDAVEPWDIPENAAPLNELFEMWTHRDAHERHCPNHAILALPWGEVRVCLNATVHAPDAELPPDRLEELRAADQAARAPGEPLQDRPRWSVSQDAEQLIADRIREALGELPDWVLSALILGLGADPDSAPLDVIVTTAVNDLVAELRSAHRSTERLDADDRLNFPALLAGLRACVDVGAPPPNLDEIRTRLDVLTKGETGQDQEGTDA